MNYRFLRHYALLVVLGATLLPAVAQARWGKADVGYTNFARACRDGALVLAQSEFESAGDATPLVGARRYVNLNVPLDAPFTSTPRPASDYGPDVVAAPALRALSLALQPVPLADAVAPAPMLDHRRWGTTFLPWNAPLAPGDTVALVYQRAFDNVVVVVDSAVVGDCALGAAATLAVPVSALPGAPPAPGGALNYQVAGDARSGMLQLGTLRLPTGARFGADALAPGSPLQFVTPRLPVADILPLALFGIVRASAPAGNGANDAAATAPAISADGRVVVFESLASTLVVGDTNTNHDIFAFDRTTGTRTLLARGLNGAQTNDSSGAPSVSGDGQFVAFQASATNLVAGDTNSTSDIFVVDRSTTTTTLVSRTSGVLGNGRSSDPAISVDGRYVAFTSAASNLVAGDANSNDDIFLVDRQTGMLMLVSRTPQGGTGNSTSAAAAISGDGRYVAFQSSASNLVAGDTNANDDIFVFDRQTNTTRLVSRAASAPANGFAAAPSISADGRVVAFHSDASNLVAGDTNTQTDVFVVDTTSGAITRVSVAANGGDANGASTSSAISGDGRVVAFSTDATDILGGDENNAPDVVLRVLADGTTARLSRGWRTGNADRTSLAPSLSTDGRFAVFESYAADLLPTAVTSVGDIYLAERSTALLRVGTPPRYLPWVRR